MRRRGRWRGAAPAKLPGGEADRDRDGGEERHDERRGRGAPTTRHRRQRGDRLLVVMCETGVVLVEVDRAVEAEELGVLPEEPARVNLARKELEPLALEGLQVALADPQLALDRVELEPALVSGCPQTGS